MIEGIYEFKLRSEYWVCRYKDFWSIYISKCQFLLKKMVVIFLYGVILRIAEDNENIVFSI